MSRVVRARGPVMVDISGMTLTDTERARLNHPSVGGVVLFRRNFASLDQLQRLTADIHALRSPALLIAVDHEGGRVQRFEQGFTRLPPMRVLGELWDADPDRAVSETENVGYVLAAELRAAEVDVSFTPVLDLDWGRSAVIGNRAFHHDAEVISQLAMALQRGLKRAGLGSCGKHFPGHGWVEGDSHHTIAIDERSLMTLRQVDLIPFQRLINAGLVAVMPAHVVYPAVDNLPAGFSRIWLQHMLRDEFGFDGVIFSDDLCMEGASGVGGIVERAELALTAGCDMVLVCNRPDLADQLLAKLSIPTMPMLATRLERLMGKREPREWQQEIASAEFAACRARVVHLDITDRAL